MILDGISIFDGEKQYLSLDTNLKTDIVTSRVIFFKCTCKESHYTKHICDRYLFDMVVKYDP